MYTLEVYGGGNGDSGGDDSGSDNGGDYEIGAPGEPGEGTNGSESIGSEAGDGDIYVPSGDE